MAAVVAIIGTFVVPIIGPLVGLVWVPAVGSVACAATGLVGKESDLFRFTVKHSLVFAAIIGIICTLQAYVFTWMIP